MTDGWTRTGVLVAAFFISFILFLAGYYSGMSAESVIRNETTGDIAAVQGQITRVEESLDSLQLGRFFSESLGNQSCGFMQVIIDSLKGELGEYWARLPLRIEAYAKEHSDGVSLLLERYNKLSLRAFIIFDDASRKCANMPVAALMLYGENCSLCVKQGVEFDELKNKSGEEIIVFSVDSSTKHKFLDYLKAYYGISQMPAVVIKGRMFQGELVTASRLTQLLEGEMNA